MGGQAAANKRHDAKRGSRLDRHQVRTDMKDAQAARRKVFNFVGKTYGLTFSDAGGIESKEALHSYLQNLLGVHHCCVSRELHESGEQHFHVAGRLDHKFTTTDCHFFDYMDDTDTNNHPNIVKGGPAWLTYVMKGEDYVSTYPSKPNVMADALACSSTERALDHIRQHDAGSYVKFGISIEKNLQRHYGRTNRVSVPRWSGPYPAGRYPPDWNPHTHALHLWGPPGSGKTCFAQHLLREHFGDCEYVKAHPEALKTLSFTKPFVFDEAMFLLHPAAMSREITDVVSGGVVDARYNAITIPPGIPRVFVSNQRWVFKNPDESVYGRRLLQYEMPHACMIEEWRLYNPPRSPSPPPPPPGSPPPGSRSPPPPPPYPKAPPPLPPPVPEVDDEDHEYFSDEDTLSFGGETFATLTSRWEADVDEFVRRPRPSSSLAIGAAPTPEVFLPRTPPLPAPGTPMWSPGWSPMLPFESDFEMDIDPFMQDELSINREDL